MSTEKRKQGFAVFPKDKLREVSSKGGSKTGNKGYALLSPEARRANASMASKARWDKVKEQRNKENKDVTDTTRESTSSAEV